MSGARIVGVIGALSVATFFGIVVVGLMALGQPANAAVSAAGVALSVLGAFAIAVRPAGTAAGVAIALGILSGLGAVTAGANYAPDGYWLGITAVLLIVAGFVLWQGRTATAD